VPREDWLKGGRKTCAGRLARNCEKRSPGAKTWAEQNDIEAPFSETVSVFREA